MFFCCIVVVVADVDVVDVDSLEKILRTHLNTRKFRNSKHSQKDESNLSTLITLSP